MQQDAAGACIDALVSGSLTAASRAFFFTRLKDQLKFNPYSRRNQNQK